MGIETETQREEQRNGHLGPAFLQLNPSEEEAGGGTGDWKAVESGRTGAPPTSFRSSPPSCVTHFTLL